MKMRDLFPYLENDDAKDKDTLKLSIDKGETMNISVEEAELYGRSIAESITSDMFRRKVGERFLPGRSLWRDAMREMGVGGRIIGPIEPGSSAPPLAKIPASSNIDEFSQAEKIISSRIGLMYQNPGGGIGPVSKEPTVEKDVPKGVDEDIEKFLIDEIQRREDQLFTEGRDLLLSEAAKQFRGDKRPSHFHEKLLEKIDEALLARIWVVTCKLKSMYV